MKLAVEAVIEVLAQLLLWLCGWVVGRFKNWRVMLIATQVVVEVNVKLGKKRGEYEAEIGHKKKPV